MLICVRNCNKNARKLSVLNTYLRMEEVIVVRPTSLPLKARCDRCAYALAKQTFEAVS